MSRLSGGFAPLLYLFQSLLRRAWLARILLFLVLLAPALASEESFAATLEHSAIPLIVVFVMVRFGLISVRFDVVHDAGAAQRATHSRLVCVVCGPLVPRLLFFVALLVAAAYTSLGGKPIFGRTLLDD